MSGPLLAWLRSFLSGRSQRVVVNGVGSSFLPINAGVPQFMIKAASSPLYSSLSSLMISLTSFKMNSMSLQMIVHCGPLYTLSLLAKLLQTLCQPISLPLRVESNVSDNDVKSQDADSADTADSYVSCGPRPWTQDEQRWETASAPSRWNPSPSASRARSVDRSRCKFGASLRSQTAVAAQLSGLNVQHEAVFTDIRKGTKRKGSVLWPPLKSLPDNVCVSTLLVSQVTVGEECKTEAFAKWLQASKEHMIVVTLTKLAVKAGSDMQKSLQQATAASVHQALLQQGGHKGKIKIIERANANSGSTMKTAVTAACDEKFALKIFDDTYVFAHKWLIADLCWTEWDAGQSLSRFGSLSFSFHEDRHQHTKYTVGIVYIPDDTLPTDDVWDILASWIKGQDIPLVTGNFGYTMLVG